MPPLGEAIAFLHRRHLTYEQRAMAASAYQELRQGLAARIMADGAARGASHGKKGGRGKKNPP